VAISLTLGLLTFSRAMLDLMWQNVLRPVSITAARCVAWRAIVSDS